MAFGKAEGGFIRFIAHQTETVAPLWALSFPVFHGLFATVHAVAKNSPVSSQVPYRRVMTWPRPEWSCQDLKPRAGAFRDMGWDSHWDVY
jgi:hypothetical protein